MNIEYKPAELHMAETIHGLIRQLGHERVFEDFHLEFSDKLSHKDFDLFVAITGEQVIAFAELHYSKYLHKAAPWAKLVSFCVDDHHRNKQIGTDFLHFLELRCKEKDCECLELISNHTRTDAHRFYERNGYEEYKKMFIKRFA